PLPAFYHHPKNIEEMVNETVERVLEVSGVAQAQPKAWTGL
ncbi:MAG: 3-octaprenyl-4-hydroxybenzoate carboxy-lyase, partial [Massilia sp.]